MSSVIEFSAKIVEICGRHESKFVIIVITCLAAFDVPNFEVKLSFLIKPFSYMTKKSGEKFKYIKNIKTFQHEIKTIFHYI